MAQNQKSAEQEFKHEFLIVIAFVFLFSVLIYNCFKFDSISSSKLSKKSMSVQNLEINN